MERVAGSANLNQAYKRVKANQGTPGVDGMTVTDLFAWIGANRERLIASLLDGSYRPQPVRGAHDALRQAREYVADGHGIVVDLDLEKFFDRVMASVTGFLEGRLKLRVNREKSAVAPVGERQFLGHRLNLAGTMGIAPKSLARAKDRLRRITRRNRGIALERMIAEVKAFTTGWVTYFRQAQCQSALRDLDGWLRRKLRCVRLKRCKRAKTIHAFLKGNSVPGDRAWTTAASGKGWWRMAASPAAHEAMNTAWFKTLEQIAIGWNHLIA